MEFDRNPTLDALCARKSVRVFTEEPVPQAVKNALFQAAMQAPTAGNQMLYTILDTVSYTHLTLPTNSRV